MNDSNHIETHISTLFFTPDRVFKLLKPIANGFLDHRESLARCQAAKRELELNRRISPDVYLGTADVVENGVLVDQMIVMRRLPAERSVTNLLRNGQLTEEHIRSIARKIAEFHCSLPPIEPAEPLVDIHRRRWIENTTEIAEFVGPVLLEPEATRIEELAVSWLDSHGDLLEKRVADGYVRDGHGDLLADDIFCSVDGPKILDCLAFRDDFRQVDVLDDVSFLAMDLHRLSGSYWAQQLLHYYKEFMGESHPGSLAHYYLAYRAHVRSKIACLRWKDGDAEFGAVARMYHKLCLDHLERARLRVIMVGGGPATGKSTLSRSLGEQLGAPVLSSDEIRKDLAHVERTAHIDLAPDAGIYSPEFTERTYDEMLRRAGLLIASGESVVLDASWSTQAHRHRAVAMAENAGAELIPIECVVPPAIASERLIRRSADPFAVSDATPEIAEYLRDRREQWPESIEIDTARAFCEVEADALHAIRCFGRTSWVAEAEEGESFWGARPEGTYVGAT